MIVQMSAGAVRRSHASLVQESRTVKYVPNILSSLRIALALSLFLFEPLGTAFLVVYALCGITDIADGIIARACNATSDLGGKLDSLGDFVMAIVAVVIIVPIVNPPTFIWAWIAAIAIARICSPGIAYFRHRQFGMVHTAANKVTGLLLFLYPFTLVFGVSEAVLVALCIIATLSALEEIAVQLTSTHYQANRLSLLSREQLR